MEREGKTMFGVPMGLFVMLGAGALAATTRTVDWAFTASVQLALGWLRNCRIEEGQDWTRRTRMNARIMCLSREESLNECSSQQVCRVSVEHPSVVVAQEHSVVGAAFVSPIPHAKMGPQSPSRQRRNSYHRRVTMRLNNGSDHDHGSNGSDLQETRGY